MEGEEVRSFLQSLFVSSVLFLGIACASPAIVLKRTPHLQEAGATQARQDVATCEAESRAFLTAKGYDGVSLPPIGNLQATRGVIIDTATPRRMRWEATYQQYVERCLTEHGYEVVGWK